ncbi:hypothetical protein J3E74DRAFT_405547 [Bipolaris maydis]|nr:hypothetical protein J3E74DRAFT_405547 [Bipolaris maydis]
MAVIGQLIQDRNLAAANSIWTTANVLIVLGLEVDNREARNVELLNAWALLATYGATCADPVFWQQMNITQGYVGTAARRLCGDLTAIIEW